MSEKKPVPVCTLFSESGSNIDDFHSSSESSNASASAYVSSGEKDTSDNSNSVVAQPALCNVFASSSTSLGGGDDIFSKISEDASEGNSEISEHTKSSEDSTQMETLRLNRSVDSFIVEELADSDVITDKSLNLDALDKDRHNKVQEQLLKPSAARSCLDTEASSEASHKPIIASPSFLSVTSFSVTPEDTGDKGSATESMSNQPLAIEGLTIEGMKNKPVTETESLTFDESHTRIGSCETVEESSIDEASVETLSQSTESLTTGSLFTQQISAVKESPDSVEDDPFAAALSNSALDRRMNAWLPSEETKIILMSCIANQKPPNLEMKKITRPGLSTSELLEDPVKELVSRLTGSENVVKRMNLTMNDVGHNREGILKLMETGNHRSATNLCSKLLTMHGQGFGQATQLTTNTPETLWLWYTRIYILTKLKLYEMAATELSPFEHLDNPDLYYEFYPDIYPGRRGTMVPFEFRLLHAEFPRYVDKPKESLKRLHKLLHTCVKILNNLENGKTEMGEMTVLNATDIEASIKYWTQRRVDVAFCIGNTLIHLKDYTLAVDVYDEILKIRPEKAVALQSGIGRLYLHVGDIRAAQQRFASAEKSAESIAAHKVQLLLNRGFMYIATNNWQEAHTQFETVLNLEPHNITALNNKAVCLLYLGKLKEAIAVLETGTSDQTSFEVATRVENINRQQALVQGLLSNLSTLYELESSRFVLRKRALFLKHIAPNCGDSFDTACFKEI